MSSGNQDSDGYRKPMTAHPIMAAVQESGRLSLRMQRLPAAHRWSVIVLLWPKDSLT